MLYEYLLASFVFNFLHLTCIAGTFANLVIGFVNNFFLVDFFNFVTNLSLVHRAILKLRDARHVTIFILIIHFVIAWLSLGRLSTTLVTHALLIRTDFFTWIDFFNFLNKLNPIHTSFLLKSTYIIFQN